MSITYTPSVNFGAKDSLPSNDPSKVIKGSEFSVEFTAIQTAFSLAAPAASPTFTGTVTIPTADINGGAIDGTTIGGTTPAAATFTSVTATTADINGGNIDGTVIGAATPAAGSFTTGQFGTSLNVDGTVTADGLTVDGAIDVNLGSSGSNIVSLSGASAGRKLDIQSFDVGASVGAGYSINATSGQGELDFQTAGTSRLNIDAGGDISFYEDTGTTPKLFWDASAERLGLGTTSPSAPLDIVSSATGGTTIELDNTSTGGRNFTLYSSGSGNSFGAGNFAIYDADAAAVRMLVDSSGNVGIGTSSPASQLSVLKNQTADTAVEVSNIGTPGASTTASFIVSETAGVPKGWLRRYRDGSAKTEIGYSGVLAFTSGIDGTAAERARIDSSGNLLVGKTTTDIGTQGTLIKESGRIEVAKTSDTTLFLNRLSTDGEIASFRKDGSTVGSIGTIGGRLTIGSGDTGLAFDGANNRIIPHNTSTNVFRDAAIDLGYSSGRLKDIYRSGSTISTSDRNAKQDERPLTEAEASVAQACKGLLKAFRFIDAVETDGDGARIHFGIIAQDLQAAFEAEGLDANRYAMFRPSTFTDDEGNEQTRLGVCYENLLAFIIAAL